MLQRSVTFALLALPMAFGIAPVAEAQTQVAAPGQTVSTGGESRQILFRDKTSLTAGPGAAVTVSRADYDAATGKGNVVINVTKGAFRYVTGDTAGSHTIKTPLSTVGVRGTVIEGYVGNDGQEVFTLIEGAFQVCTRRGGCRNVPTPGTYVLVSSGQNITPPTPIPPGLLSSLVTTGAAPNIVHDQWSSRFGNGQVPGGSGNNSAFSNRNGFLAPPPAGGGGMGGGKPPGYHHGKGMGHHYGWGYGHWKHGMGHGYAYGHEPEHKKKPHGKSGG